jgi:hypothetical protein
VVQPGLSSLSIPWHTHAWCLHPSFSCFFLCWVPVSFLLSSYLQLFLFLSFFLSFCFAVLGFKYKLSTNLAPPPVLSLLVYFFFFQIGSHANSWTMNSIPSPPGIRGMCYHTWQTFPTLLILFSPASDSLIILRVGTSPPLQGPRFPTHELAHQMPNISKHPNVLSTFIYIQASVFNYTLSE